MQSQPRSAVHSLEMVPSTSRFGQDALRCPLESCSDSAVVPAMEFHPCVRSDSWETDLCFPEPLQPSLSPLADTGGSLSFECLGRARARAENCDFICENVLKEAPVTSSSPHELCAGWGSPRAGTELQERWMGSSQGRESGTNPTPHDSAAPPLG